MAYSIETGDGGLYVRYSGHISSEEFMACSEKIREIVAAQHSRYVISDFLELTAHDVEKYFVLLSAAKDHLVTLDVPHIKSAVVTVDETIRELAEVYAKAPLTCIPVKVFADVEGARNWALAESGASGESGAVQGDLAP